MLTYSFSDIGSEPLYAYLYGCIKKDIAAGRIAAGMRLPSKRSLAKNLGISVITVENAYAQLVAEGYVYAVPKSGFFAADIEKSTPRLRPQPNAVGVSPPRKWFADFSGNHTDPENFPFATWAKLMREVMASRSAELMQNPPSGGVPELREAVAKHLAAFRGINASPEQIIIGAGTEYLYGLLIQLLGFDRTYAVEEPGYRRIAQICESHGVRCVAAPLDGEGVNPEALEESGVEVLHTSPSHHFPTGIVTPIARRYALLSWAAKAPNRYIIEDDYDSEFRLSGKPIPALQSIDAVERVIYMNTFTKSLASTIRISYMVLPRPLCTAFFARLGFYACTVSALEQYTLAKFIREGFFEKHINRMRGRYRVKRDALLRALRDSGLFEAAEIQREDAGLHFLLTLHKAVQPAEIVRAAAKNGVRLTALSAYYRSPPPDLPPCFVISYASLPDSVLPEAAERLFRAVSEINHL